MKVRLREGKETNMRDLSKVVKMKAYEYLLKYSQEPSEKYLEKK